MTKYTTEKDYYIAEDTSGALYLYLKAKHDVPSEPKIFYDGQTHAVFVRSPDENIILDYINPQVRQRLQQSREIVVVETVLGNIADIYIAEMKSVHTIAVDWQKLGLKKDDSQTQYRSIPDL
jgi:extradiol dioxygenase family protein